MLLIAFIILLVRLVNGNTELEGRVEVYYNGTWGTVCDDGWDLNDAQVVCRQLGFGPAVAARSRAFYREGNDRIWLDDVNCVGTELNIEDCSHNGWEFQNCSHGLDAGVQCSNGKVQSSYYECTYNYKCATNCFYNSSSTSC